MIPLHFKHIIKRPAAVRDKINFLHSLEEILRLSLPVLILSTFHPFGTETMHVCIRK